MSIRGTIADRIGFLNIEFIHTAKEVLQLLLSDRITTFALVILISIISLGIFGPMITPYEYDARQRGDDGRLLDGAPPSAQHLLGTTDGGQDVLSRLLYGARSTIIIGGLGGSLIVSIGLLIGTISGYFGGKVDGILMRFTDTMYSVPFIPTAIVLITFFGIGFWTSIFILGGLLWRGNARIFRSQVLQMKERPYVTAAQTLGASDIYVIRKHILPNMGGMIMLFFALGVGLSILMAASLSFLGLVNPFIPSWGIMLRNAYNSGIMTTAWWWTLPPGILISLTVLSTFLLGRGYERLQQEKIEGAIVA